MDMNAIIEASRRHPVIPLPGEKLYRYGTSGFRMRADHLDGPTFRSGLIAAMRSRKLSGQAIGVVITASHNPPVDNGVKLVDPMGEMLDPEWEEYASGLFNCATDEGMAEAHASLYRQLHINPASPARVVFARDTRPSGHTLAAALTDALIVAGAEYTDYKILTTPQLHYITRCINTIGFPNCYGTPTELGYCTKLSAAFLQALGGRTISGPLYVDCANGVGGPRMHEFLKHLPSPDKTGLQIKLVNDDILRPEALNLDCGADFVKTKVRAPPSPKPVLGARYCSFDGDADRLVYYWTDPNTGFFMLDGDRIAALAAVFLTDLVRSAGLGDEVRIGVVQTAYANGASTTYIEKGLGLPVVCTATGVRHLHHAACAFDIGIYFEANGHGTVLFSPHTQRTMREREPQSPHQKDCLQILVALTDMVNQSVGDAISDMLLVEVILAHKAWSPRDWSSIYTDLPNRLVRIEVLDKDLFIATDAERRLSHPPGAQQAIDLCVSKYTNARAFARASGTENACRVYVEAATRSEADELASKVAQIVRQYGS